MAIYTDFFVAEPEEIPRLFFPNDLRNRPTVPAKNILPDSLAELDFILTGETHREPQLVRESGDLQVYALARGLCASLADLSDGRLCEVANEWGHGDEMFLCELRELVQISLASGKKLYVYL